MIWSCTGHARGQPMTACRANLYGRIAGLLFIQRFSDYFACPINCTIQQYSDDKNLARIKDFQENTTRAWEAQMANHDALTTLAGHLTSLRSIAPGLQECRHVRRNQNKRSRVQLNRVETQKDETDQMATTLLLSLPNHSRHSPTIPWHECPVYLLHKNKPYTCEESGILRWSWRTREFKQYMAGRGNWSTTEASMIDWDSFAMARKKMSPGQRKFSTKLLIGWLPSHTRMEYYGQPNNECMQCGETEDNDHLLRCPHDCEDWDEESDSFQAYLINIGTKPSLIQVMSYGLQVWKHQTDTTTAAHRLIVQNYNTSAQTKVGWSFFARGLLTCEWKERQLEFLRRSKPNTPHSHATSWSQKVSNWLIQHALEKWNKRNQLVHAKSDAESGHVSHTSQMAALQVDQLYTDSMNADATTKAMFPDNKDDIMQRPLNSLINWIRSTSLTAKLRAKHTTETIQRTHRDISSYWQRPTTCNITSNPPQETHTQAPPDNHHPRPQIATQKPARWTRTRRHKAPASAVNAQHTAKSLHISIGKKLRQTLLTYPSSTLRKPRNNNSTMNATHDDTIDHNTSRKTLTHHPNPAWCMASQKIRLGTGLSHRLVKSSRKASKTSLRQQFVARAKAWTEDRTDDALHSARQARSTPTIQWQCCSAYLLHHQKPFTSSETYMLRWTWRTTEFKEYLAHRWAISKQLINSLDWDAYSIYRSQLSGAQNVFATKLLIGWIATGTRMEMYGSPDHTCMQCGQREDTDHILRCPVDGADWVEQCAELRHFLISIDTQPAIIQLMTYGVSVWLHDNDTTPETHRLIKQAYVNCAQTKIGWRFFMRGLIAVEWRERQLTYLRADKPKTPTRKAVQWSHKVTRWMLQSEGSKWKNRNDLVHAKSDKESGHVSREATNTETLARALYTRAESADHTTQEMFQQPVEEILARPLHSLRAWRRSSTEKSASEKQ